MDLASKATRADGSPWKAAQRALSNRLESVERWMRKARRRSDDPEVIHQLRVATRRADSALRLFRDWLPRRKRKSLVQSLRRVRRRAAAVRDLDVAVAWEVANAKAMTAVAPRRLAEWKRRTSSRRRRAVARLQPLVQRSARRAWRTRAAQLADRWRWRGRGNEPVWGRWRRGVAHELRRLPARDAKLPRRSEQLHDIRKLARDCRYQVELLAGCEPSGDESAWQPLLDSLRRFQELLGILQDQAIQLAHFKRWLAETDLDSREQAEMALAVAQHPAENLVGTRRALRRTVWQIHKAATRFDHE